MPLRRCEWPKSDLMIAYHDEEWGVPSHDDRHLFEHLVLEGAQAGLSWELVLRKRDAYRTAFVDYDLERIARFDARRIARLVADPGIIRNRQKIASVIANARAVLKIQEECGSFARCLWDLVDGRTRHNAWTRREQIPAVTPDSERVSKALVRRGVKFFGPTGAYAFMQGVGMVNDHVVGCFRYRELRRGRGVRPGRRSA